MKKIKQGSCERTCTETQDWDHKKPGLEMTIKMKSEQLKDERPPHINDKLGRSNPGIIFVMPPANEKQASQLRWLSPIPIPWGVKWILTVSFWQGETMEGGVLHRSLQVSSNHTLHWLLYKILNGFIKQKVKDLKYNKCDLSQPNKFPSQTKKENFQPLLDSSSFPGLLPYP